MQNSLTFGEIAKQPYRVSVPRKPPKDIVPPDIRSRTSQKMTDRDMEYCQTAKPSNYEVFIEVPLQKKDKRTTCLAQGSEAYQTSKKKSF